MAHVPPALTRPPGPNARATTWIAAGLGALVVVGIGARVWPRRALWLDEAQSVAIAGQALTAIPGVLRTDGAPPAYYLLLHVWMELFGDSDVAVRSLSVALSVATLAVLAVALDRFAGRRAAVTVTVLLATNPFVIRYAAEGRMYALVMLEVVVGMLAVDACLRRPSLMRAVPVAVLTALLLYTHYWAIYLVVATVIVLVVAALGDRPPRAVLVAIGGGVVAWLPWVPTFLFQSERTATPWAEPARPVSLVAVLDVGLRGSEPVPVLLGGAMGALVVLGVWRGAALVRRPMGTRALGGVLALTLVGALVGAMLSDSAYASRYTAVAVPLMITLAALGASTLPARWSMAVVGVLGVAGLVLAAMEVATDRTRSAAFVEPLREHSAAGDVLIYCPDQLGPAASRLLEQSGVDDLRQYVYPTQRAPDRVDWIDYTARHQDADPDSFIVAID
ncbi:MAG: glycosyltransferase family 39 protein, partial [Ilumatobacteraceae bacterium]